MDWDLCTNPGCSFGFGSGWAEDGVYLVSWSDNGAGGQFGYLDAQGNFVPSGNVNEITHYKATNLRERAGVVHITLTVDDFAITQDPATGEWIEIFNDTPTTNPADVGNLTVWEFTISNGAANWGRPERDKDVSFTATITPATDHKNPPNSMARHITFLLGSSQEPGWCLNATRERLNVNPRPWDDTRADDNDLKFLPDQADFLISAGLLDSNPTNYVNAWTWDEVLSKTIVVRCLDYGAYGNINALADLPPDTPMPSAARREGTLPQDNKFGAEIPIDENDNYIADVWQWDGGAANDDEETGGSANHLGDGFTRYEEYRGFKVNGMWTNLNPEANKDVFVLDWDDLGTGDFGNLGPTIHNLNTPAAQDEFSGQVINYRSRTAHRWDQHGISLRNANITDGNGNPLPGFTQPRLNGVAQCWINVQLINNTFGAQAAQARAMAIGHELGHACNLDHHGYVIVNGVPTGPDGTTIACVMCNVMNFQNLYHVYCNANPGDLSRWRLY